MSPPRQESLPLERRQRPARVLYVNGWSSCHGGSSTSLLDIVQHVDRRRVEPLVLCPEPGELPRRLADAGIPVVVRPKVALSKKTLHSYALDVIQLCRWLRRERIDLVHMNTGGWRPSIAVAARILGVPYIQHVRNVVRDASAIRANYGFRWARKIVTNSDQVGQPFADEALFRHKTCTIYNSVDVLRFDNAGDRRCEIQCLDRPVIGMVGTLVPNKGLKTVLHALPSVLENFPAAKLVVVGCAPPDEPEFERSCRLLIAELGLDGHVLLTGFRRDVPAWMNTFDVFVHPSRKEAFGKVIIEAMAAGCPVVASAVGGIPEIICRPDLGTLIPPDDPQATASAILRYLENRQLSSETGRAAAADVRRRFSLESMVRKLESVYEEVLNECRSVRISSRVPRAT